MAQAAKHRKPLQELPTIPATPGRSAFFFACIGLLTFGLLSPIALLVSLLAVLNRPDGFGAAALFLSLVSTLILVDVIFLGGVIILMLTGLFMG